MCARETEFKSILFSLCYFHAVVCERRKFGAQGWNRVYPYNTGDLRISVMVLYNYLEANAKVPWEDLRYLFGEIMYGGHITDDWDRKLCKTYLEVYLHPDMVSIYQMFEFSNCWCSIQIRVSMFFLPSYSILKLVSKCFICHFNLSAKILLMKSYWIFIFFAFHLVFCIVVGWWIIPCSWLPRSTKLWL